MILEGPGSRGSADYRDSVGPVALLPGASHSAETLPFGPYLGQSISAVAARDPIYLVGLIHAEVGPPELRAAAAKALLGSGWRPGDGSSGEGAGHRVPGPGRWTARLLAGGVALAVALGLWDAMGGARWAWPGAPPHGAASAQSATVPTAGQAATAPGAARPAAVDTRLVGGTGTAAPTLAPSGTDGAAAVPAGPSDPAAPTGTDACLARVPGAIGADVAGEYLDTFQAVAFQVVATKDTGKVTFLNSRVPYNGAFYVAIFPTLYDQLPAPPAQYFRGKCVVVQGRVELYRGTPQLVVQSVGDIQVLDGG